MEDIMFSPLMRKSSIAEQWIIAGLPYEEHSLSFLDVFVLLSFVLIY